MTGKKGGRPKIELTQKEWKQIEQACGIQCTAEEIASLMGFSVDTLERRIHEKHNVGFADFYKTHSAQGKISIRRWQYKAAERGSVPMLIWLGKQYLGQRDDRYDDGNRDELADVLKKVAEKLPGA